MDKRYQIFVSSMYADLKEERQKVARTLLELDCIPAGIEFSPAKNDDQMEFIKRILDDCDYYVLIVGGGNESMTPSEFRYTEQEYDYAISLGMKVLVFIYKSPYTESVEKSGTTSEIRENLDTFRDRDYKGHIVRHWEDAAEIPGLVALSLPKTIKMHPAVGWVRANGLPQHEVFHELNELRKEIREVRAGMENPESIAAAANKEKLAALDETHEVTLIWEKTGAGMVTDEKECIRASWGDIFDRIAPDLVTCPDDENANRLIGSSLYRHQHPSSNQSNVNVRHDDFNTLRTQYSALGLIRVERMSTTNGAPALFWFLTDRGMNLMRQLQTVKSTSNAQETTHESGEWR